MLKFVYCFFFLLYSYTLLSQSRIGIRTSSPSEAIDTKGSLRIRKLPINLANNAISTFFDGTKSTSQDQPFTATKTIVVDANGVLGVLEGIPVVELPDVKSIAYSVTTSVIDNNVRQNSITKIGNLAVYLDAQNGSGAANVRFCLLNGIYDNITINEIKLGSGGGPYHATRLITGVSANPNLPNNLANSLPASVDGASTYWLKTTERLSITNRDYGQFIIALINTKELYRVTTCVNNAAPNGYVSNGIASLATVTFFIERLTNY